MDKLLLKFVSFFDPMLERTDVNIEQLHEILRIKLIMDNRRPKATFGRKTNAKANKTTSIWGNIFLIIPGLLMGFTLFVFKTPLLGQTVYFSIFMALMALTLISDFTTVLIDTRDQFIISPRPVNDRTMAIARFMHITLYITRIALLFGLPSIILIGLADSWAACPLFFVQTIEATLLSVLLVNLVYFVLIKLVDPQRFKDIISYIQITFSVIVFAAYYLVPRLINLSVLEHSELLTHNWAYFLPPVWIASLNEAVLHAGRASILIPVMAFVGLIFPIVGIWFVAKVLATGFNRSLAIVSTADGNTTTPVAGKPYKTDLRDKLANLLAPNPTENAGFKITWKIAARTREFKMKVFPAFAYVPIYFLYLSLNTKGDLSEKFEKVQASASYIFLIYFTTLVLSSILQNVSQSAKYKSAWVYYALPVDKPGSILAGMYKAIIVLYFFPYCLILSVASVFIWGPGIINDIILAFTVSTIYGMLMALFMVKGLPFSKPIMVKAGSGKMIISLVIMSFIIAIAFGHRFLLKWELLIWCLIIPALLINWIMFRQYKKQSWNDIEMADM